MNYVGIDLHKKTITVCVLDQFRTVRKRRTLSCAATESIRAFFDGLRPFRATVEATASYLWLVDLIEPLAEEVILAHPGKLRIIAESTKKTDRLDAQILAEFLVLDMIPRAHRPTPRQREHRALVRHRQYLRQCATALKSKRRRIASDSNADRRDLFSAVGWKSLEAVKLSASDRFVLEQLWTQWQHLEGQLEELRQCLKAFAAKARARG